MMKFIDELKKEELDGKKVILRADLDVPLRQLPTANHQSSTKIGDDFRIRAQKETLDYLVDAGAKILVVAHLGHEVSDKSFAPVVEEIGKILGQTLTLVPHAELASVDILFRGGQVLLLDNIRQDEREVQNDEGLAAELSNGFDYYVDDAFATAHRSHASIVAVTKHLPAYAGFLIKKETENLKQAMEAPTEGKILVLGGAKISTKLPVIKNFLDRAEKILIGGALANNFFKMQGINVGSSVIDDSVFLDVKSDKIILPRDFLAGNKNSVSGSASVYNRIMSVENDEAILDIGPETIKEWTEIIKHAKMVIWNGPMGYSEHKDFAVGTKVIAEAVAAAGYSIIGGGDTIAAVDKLGLLDKYSFVSTGGGSMLSFLAGEKLAGLEALSYYEN
ncbi:MAG: phosphoglycerate kinase [Candidatus Yanofskybacteria bacterium RIFCSPHIGHO2_01_FULL_44_17]|uniref:Phosphoglycerate kinase n=1 Tax=Candidatus Yanofskybacteria bacterium RIFCSPHIGHO2_01_FULL_44_17 TaxID=1802668 RepID=A0A1F8ESL8_9BACT|nr:MAG: phosphoglycerate kinase [Candidatus Yanofskybacteria bacterium RIFCSPHIGHO2_01_FULL_44_17]